MAILGLVDSSFLGDGHTWGFTIANVNLTGKRVVMALSLINPKTGSFDLSDPAVVKDSDNVGETTLINAATGEIDVHLEPEDTDELTEVGAGGYQFQCRVYDAGVPVVVSEGVHTFRKTIVTP